MVIVAFFSLSRQLDHPSAESAALLKGIMVSEWWCSSVIAFSSSQWPATSVSKLPPTHLFTPLLHVTVYIPKPCSCVWPCWVWMKGGGACLFSSPSSSQTGGEEWICMGVTNPGSFLSNIPSLCDKAAVYADRENTLWGNCQHLSRCCWLLAGWRHSLVTLMMVWHISRCRVCD